MINKYILILIFIPLFSSYGQSDGFPYEYIKDIKNNLLSYRIYYLSNIVESEYEFTTKCLLPGKNESLVISLDNVDFEFPDKSFKLYKVVNNNYVYHKKINDSTVLDNKRGCGYVPYSYNSLVAYKKGKILFVSGMLFKDPISRYFDLDIADPKTFKKFLKLKLFNYGIQEIKFVKKKKKYLLFEGYPYPVKMKIKVDIKNFDNITVEEYPK
ncbi:hypothetical protein ACG2LH_11585 [Zhouia sp. PK063]|uniref:hypothetical protein n=1 Tax=Zhouia sp. PK063 TaxID=3373602 RepID=UPI0037B06937